MRSIGLKIGSEPETLPALVVRSTTQTAHMLRSVLAALAVALLAATPAAAEPVEITAQAKAARAEFLRTATPPGPAAVICLVDTGVNINPDTPGVIARVALDGPVSDQSPTLHGTRMAMFIGAPSNGFGMVGIWPAARIVSVRANVAGQDAFTLPGYNFGLKQCDKDAAHYGSKVGLLTMSSEVSLTPEAHEELSGTVAAARAHGLNVVVAAGNNDRRPPGAPANLAGALSVGAASTGSGELCGFSASGALLVAPGCGLDAADPLTGQPTTSDQGTSRAAAIVATALAALRTWRPDLTVDEADRLLTETATPTLDGRRIDVAAAFIAAGLGALVPPAATPPPPPPLQPTVKQRLVKPKFSVRTRGRGSKRTLVVRVGNRPRGVRVSVRVYARGRSGKLRRVASRTRTSSTIRIRARSWRRVTAAFSDPSGQLLTSPSAVVNARR